MSQRMILYQMEKHLPAPSSPSLLPETVEREAGASQAGDTMRELGDGTVLLKPAGLVVIWKQIQDTRQCVRAQTAALKALEKRMRDQEMELRGVAHSELQAAWAQNWYIRQWLGEQRAEVEGCEILLSDLWVQADKLLASSSSHGLCPVWDQIQSIRLGLNQRAGELEGHQKQLDVQKEKISYHRSKALEEKKRDHERDAMLDDAVSKSFVFLVHPKRAPNASGKSYIDLRRQFLDDFRREGAGRGTTELGLAADCMADAALYASGERDDPVTLSAIYGVPPDRVTSLSLPKDRETIARINMHGSVVTSKNFAAHGQPFKKEFDEFMKEPFTERGSEDIPFLCGGLFAWKDFLKVEFETGEQGRYFPK